MCLVRESQPWLVCLVREKPSLSPYVFSKRESQPFLMCLV
jgi:hypothetical protein